MKQLASTYIFATIAALFVFSLFFIFVLMPSQKSDYYEQRASQSFYESQIKRLSNEKRQEAAEKANADFIKALRNSPYDAGLWIRLASVQKTLGDSEVAENDTLSDAVRIARKLRPDIKTNLDRIIIQINKDKQGSVYHE